MTAERASRVDTCIGCVLAREVGVLVVLTGAGVLRASYAGTLLDAVARDRASEPEPGEWVSLRRWCDGPLTVERALGRSTRPALADIVPLRRSCAEPVPPRD